jgi:hypothetical protein
LRLFLKKLAFCNSFFLNYFPGLLVPAEALEEKEVPVPEVLHAAEAARAGRRGDDPDQPGQKLGSMLRF